MSEIFEKLFLDKPMFLGLLVFVVALSALKGIFKSKPRRNWRQTNNQNWRNSNSRFSVAPKANQTPTELAAEQLKMVMRAKFSKRPLLNQKEMKVFSAIEKLINAEGVDWRLMAQVSLGEIVGSADKGAYLAVNSKRVDLLLIDGDAKPLHAIEYQGAGHHQGSAAVRDAVKKEALRRAGIGYLEVIEGDRLEDLKTMVAKLVRQSKLEPQSVFGKK